jgi:hypothetical protein
MTPPKRVQKTGRFAPGSTGNPNGRPRKHRQSMRYPHHIGEVITNVAETVVSAKDGAGDRVEVNATVAVMTALRNKALAGHAPSMRFYLQTVRQNTNWNEDHMIEMGRMARENRMLREQLGELAKLIPSFKGHGVVTVMPDGSVYPSAWIKPDGSAPEDVLPLWQEKPTVADGVALIPTDLLDEPDPLDM